MGVNTVTLKERLAGYHWIRRRWPKVCRRAITYMMPLELAGVIPMLILSSIAAPDLWRTTMWTIGWINGLNSNPNMILYAYANYQPLPHVPLVWSQTLTNMNEAIAVVALFFLMAKLIFFILNVWFPIFACFSYFGISAIYAVSVYGQIGPDYADPQHPAPAAWYFRFGCGLAKKYGKLHYCQMSQASLGITLYLLVLWLLNLGFSAYAMKPDERNNRDELDDDDDDDDDDSVQSSNPKVDELELQGMGFKSPIRVDVRGTPCTPAPNTPFSPFTPRTQAFRTLNRQPVGGARTQAS